VELPPVTVQGSPVQPASLVQPTPEAQAEALQTTPGGVNLIDATQYTTGRAATIVDVLRNQPGVVIGTRGSGDEAKISIRGSGVDRNFHLRGIRLLQDGMPMSQADGNGDFQWIEPLAQRNVEVYRGGNALQYGATTLGGAINFVSPTGYTASGIQARTETGSFGYIKGQVSSGMVLGKLDYYLSGTSFYRNGYQEHSRDSAQRYTGNIGYRFSPDLETRFYGGYINSKLQLPGSLTRGQLRHNPRGVAPNSLDFDERHDLLYAYLSNKTTKRIGDHQQVESNIYWTNQRLDHPLFWNTFFLNGLGVITQRANTYGTSLRYENNHDLFGQRNSFVLGVSPQMTFADNQRFRNLSGRGRGLKTADSGEFSANFDLYAENRHHVWRDLALVLGGQASYAVRNYNDRFNRNPNGNQTRNQDYFSVNPKAGLLYNLTPTTQVYANYNRSFEPPTMLEIVQLGGIAGNVLTQDLKAQTANTIEFGTRGRLKRLAWDTTFYRSWVRNELLTLNDALGNPLGTNNGSRTVHQGIEAGLSLVLAEGLFTKTSARDNLTALPSVGPGLSPQTPTGKDRLVWRQVYDWTYLRFKDDRVYGRNRLPGVPPQLYRSELIYEHPCGFYLQPNLEWSMTKYPIDYANTMTANPYAILGLRTGYRSKRGWSAFLEFRNLTGKRYASAVQVIADARTDAAPRVFSPGQGFSVYGGIELRW
jgi:iron complex outermembrane receptor protein